MNIIMDDTLVFFDEDQDQQQLKLNGRKKVAAHSSLWFIELGSKIFKSLGRRTNPALNQLLKTTDNLKGIDSYLIQVSSAFEDRGIEVEDLTKRVPYTKPGLMAEHLEGAVERGWMEAADDFGYKGRCKSRQLNEQMVATAKEIYCGLNVLPEDEMDRITELLANVVDAAAELDQPAAKNALEWSLNFEPEDDKLPILNIRRLMMDLFAFRDDTHIAAWKSLEEYGYVWEAFTYVDSGEANTPAELAERLSYRGYSKAEYEKALWELVERRWIAEHQGRFTVTVIGKTLREVVEMRTNQYFDVPWDTLGANEINELKSLMGKLVSELEMEAVPEKIA